MHRTIIERQPDAHCIVVIVSRPLLREAQPCREFQEEA